MSAFSMRMGLGLGAPSTAAGGNVGLEAETTAYLAAMSSAPTDPDIIAAYDNLIKNLKAATVGEGTVNLYDKLDVMYLFLTAHTDAADTLINVIDPSGTGIGPAVLEHIGENSDPSWATKVGFSITKGQNYINSDYQPINGVTKFGNGSNMSGMVFYEAPANTGSNEYAWGYVSADNNYYVLNPRKNEDIVAYCMNDMTGITPNNDIGAKTIYIMSRISSNAVNLQTEGYTYNATSYNENTAYPSWPMNIGCGTNLAGSPIINGKTCKAAAWFAGSGITEAEGAALIEMIQTYVTAMKGVS